MKKQILLLFLFLFLSKISAQNPGDLMTDFGIGGKVLTNFGIDPINIKKQFIQNDGKIILVGIKQYNYSVDKYFTFIIRLNADSTLDNTFNSTGIVISDVVKYFKTVKISVTGKIIIGGTNTIYDSQFVLCQYNSDGSIDTSFGTAGVINAPNSYFGLIDFDVQSDGKVVVIEENYVARFNTNGTLDTTFNNGQIFPIISLIYPLAKIIKIKNDNTIIIGGTNGGAMVLIKKFNANGYLDTSFNSTGTFTAGFINEITSLDVATNGKIIFYHRYYVTSGSNIIHRYYLLQLNADGTSDTTFGVNGVIIDDVIIPGYSPPYMPNNLPYVGKIKFQPDGKSVIVDEIYIASTYEKDIAVIKHNADGTLDGNFGDVDGRVILSDFNLKFSSPDFNFKNNKIFISGNTNITDFENNIVLTQLNEDGSLDDTYNDDGDIHLFLPYPDDDRMNKILLQPDNKIVVAGATFQNFRYRAVLARYNSNGTLDMSFGTNGRVFLGSPSFYPEVDVTTPILDSDNKVIFLLSNRFYSILYKFNTDGSLDTTFGTTGILDLSTYGILGKDVKVDADNNIFIAGSSLSISNSDDQDFAIVKINNEGIIDTSFGTNGMTNIGSSSVTTEQLEFLQILSNGKLIAIGRSDVHSFTVFKYDSTGLLDTTFNGNGQVLFNGSFLSPVDIDITNDAIFVLYLLDSQENVVAKLNQDGSFDSVFGINGITEPNLSFISVLTSLNILPNGSLVLSGRYTTDNEGITSFLLINFNSNGSHNLAFGNNGVVITDFNGNDGLSNDLVITNDNSVILGGVGFNNNDNMIESVFAMAKFYIGNTLANDEYIYEQTTTFYPNPASNYIYINSDVKSFTIYTLDGKKVKTSIQNQSIDVSRFSDGIYVIKAHLNNGQTVTKKLVIK